MDEDFILSGNAMIKHYVKEKPKENNVEKWCEQLVQAEYLEKRCLNNIVRLFNQK